jgi:hypothetical protein
MKTLLKTLLVFNVFVNAYLIYKVAENHTEYSIALIILFIVYAITTNIILGEVILEQKKVDKK